MHFELRPHGVFPRGLVDELLAQLDGRAGPGKMKAAYFSPVMGEQDEICFLHYPSRAPKHVETALGLQRPNGAVLHSDGYSADEHYAKKTGITHAQCWPRARRKIFDTRDIEPAQADQALHAIAALYKAEQQIRDDGLTGQAKRASAHATDLERDVCRQSATLALA
ncbi:IS66 family transposase [Massilia genomosp. 1]|uniref:Transposase n=1 Tax=Massilia genomosp. 1 TaxID=2609280 RepID=A0ABX0MPE3_9BURK|nr:transposase [Massilia genomosp. 1]NHZ61249.1 transposase [Massilia genomosp. 1]